jgi:preprotein translocase subunit SecA
MNIQRNLIYEQRRKVLDGEDVRASIQGMIDEVITSGIGGQTPENGRSWRKCSRRSRSSSSAAARSGGPKALPPRS